MSLADHPKNTPRRLLPQELALIYVSHLEDDNGLTVCGMSWQGWQRPNALVKTPPYVAPEAGVTDIQNCDNCLRRVAR